MLELAGAFVLLLGASQGEAPLPRAMAVLGDSISEGMFSGFSLEHPPTTGQVLAILQLAATTSGASRMEAFRKKYAKPERSWATGTSVSDLVTSHLERLRSENPKTAGFNFAVSGNESKNLPEQVDALLKTESDQKAKIDYVTVLIGANDFNHEKLEEITPPLVYAANLEAAFRRLLAANPNRSLFVVGIPDVLKVFRESENFELVILGKRYTCDEIRKEVYGDLIVFKSKDQVVMDKLATMFRQYRDATVRIVERLQEDFPQARIKTSQDPMNPTQVFKALSVDCFHPSEWGQAELAELSWKAGFWPFLDTAPAF